jgi:SAM-dependent methyltransferase
MNAISTAAVIASGTRPAKIPGSLDVRALFSEAQEDFRRWSPGYNMHFGWWEPGMDTFHREPMLEKTNEEVAAALALPANAPSRVIDLGCGAASTSRTVARLHPRCDVTAVTIVPEQIALGSRLNRGAGLARRIAFMLSDFAGTWAGTSSQDAAFAIESFCYGEGAGKRPAVREAARLLKPGGRLVVVDGFLLREPHGALGWVYRRWCASWAVGELARLDAFESALRDAGFEAIEVRDLFWKVAPSAAHIPLVATVHTLRELWKSRGRLSAWRWKHIAASWLSIAIGLARGTFRYAMVTARKRGPA